MENGQNDDRCGSTHPEGPFTLETVELDDLRADEVLVRIEAAGVCHTDLEMQHIVPMPAVVGHESAGVVEEVGPAVDYVKPGDRVIISWPACGECPSCISGRRDLCHVQFPLLFSGRRLDGSSTIKLGDEWISGAFFQQSSFAEYSIAPAGSLVKVEDDLPWELLAALPCGVMTGSGSIINALQVGVRDDLVILGAGGVGMSAIMAGRLVGADPIIAVDINPDRLALALELGATHVVNAATDDVVARLAEIVPGGLRFAFDASGAPSSWSSALLSLGNGGVFGIAAPPRADGFGVDPNVMLSKARSDPVHPGRRGHSPDLLTQAHEVVQAGTIPRRQADQDLSLRRHQRGLRRGESRPGGQAGAAHAVAQADACPPGLRAPAPRCHEPPEDGSGRRTQDPLHATRAVKAPAPIGILVSFVGATRGFVSEAGRAVEAYLCKEKRS